MKLFYNFSGRNLPNYSKHEFDSMLVVDGKIKETGFKLSAPIDSIESIDLAGATVFSAFADAHVHLTQTGISLSGVRLEKASSLEEVFDLLKTESKKSTSILGWGIQETNLKEKRLPTTAELDKVCPKRFVWVSRQDLHSAVLNTEALKMARSILPELETNDGLICGSDYQTVSCHMLAHLPADLKVNGLKNAEQHCFSRGVATVHTLEGSNINEKDTYEVANFAKQSKLHCVIYHQSSNPALPLKQGWKRMGGCLLIDGSLGTRTAALYEDYADCSGSSGNLYMNAATIEDLLTTARENDMQLAIHAIGDRAIDAAVLTYAWANEKWGYPTLPGRIEHFILPSDKAIKIAHDQKIFISVQPVFDYMWGQKNGLYVQRLGEERASKLHPFKTMQSLGVSMAAGSDSPVTPIDPLLGIHAFLNHNNKDERISLNSALAQFIYEPHQFANEHKERGQLKAGYNADFVVLKNDPFRTLVSQIKDIGINALYISGSCVY